MASTVPKEVKKEIIDGWLAEPTHKVALFSSTSNCLTQSLYSACTNEISNVGTNYTTAGNALTRKAWGAGSGYVDTTNAFIDANDVSWTNATMTPRYAVWYETATSKIRAVFDFVTDKPVTGGTLTVVWNNGGLVKVS